VKLIENFDIDLESIVNMIIQEKATKVGLQLPEGFKRQAMEIAGYIEENTDAETLI
jgi:2-(3-amino-3-carboxypropyl)histidine synthase